MKIEDYFDLIAPDDIRIKGTRVGIENVLYEYIYRNRTPEEIINCVLMQSASGGNHGSRSWLEVTVRQLSLNQ
ncbi:hypothetical protein [Moorena sp. SIO3H5]|uniref:hypothetical protein n=1 Tax=Moorena sp. SIO3H5 TaxID=2607834 RepID=UPI0013B748A0|nr:hypothetical protein [Moorena sp. SIO3H5]NEO73017.1 hypothetical protein [Moorena sp. SIO3H5]